MAKIPLISLFSGAGGLDLAFERSGAFETKLLVEAEPRFCGTLRKNIDLGFFAGGEVIQADIRELNPMSAISLPAPIGLIGGPPCEAFSTMGHRRSIRDRRGLLIYEFLRWAADARFSFFLFENVPELKDADEGETFGELCRGFAEQGYAVAWSVLNAADYGAATSRRRLFVVGSRATQEFQFPAPTHAERRDLFSERHDWVAALDVIRDLCEPPRCLDDRLHKVVEHTPNVAARFATLAPGSYDNVRKRSRLHPNKPSPSLVAGNLKGTRNHIHPILPRELTNREIARIQGFPDDYEFDGSPAEVAKQITNAVPIPLGLALARAIADLLHPNSTDRSVGNSAHG